MRHYINVIRKILSTRYRHSRISVLFSYIRLITRSIAYHKLRLRKYEQSVEMLQANVLGLKICFTTYPQLIGLFEEIFIFEVYKFASIDPASAIIDCGSNIGLSVLYFKKLYPEAHITAFEPNKDAFRLLEQNIRINNLSDVSLHNIALKDSNGRAFLYKAPSAGPLTMSLVSSPEKLQTEEVTTGKLSDYIHDPVTMVKIDVEGSESSILNDLIENGKMQHIRQMIIEFHPFLNVRSVREFITRIQENNFTCRTVNDTLHPDASEMMIYCENRNRIA